MRLMHYVHELTVGGGAVHTGALLRDHQQLGYPAACVTLEDGPIGDQLRRQAIPVYVLPAEHAARELYRVALEWGAQVLHGHTCGGGSEACRVARKLQQAGYRIIGGEHIHSVVPGDNPDADFEIAEIELMRELRPRITVIPWAVDIERLAPLRDFADRDSLRDWYGLPRNAYVIARNGRLDGAKLPGDFIRCLAGLPDCWGLLAGWGPEAANLTRLAEQLGCRDRLVLSGMCERPGEVFEVADAIVYPTLDESWCAGVVEPLAWKKPVICYPRGGMAENIIHGQTGLHAQNVRELIAGVQALRKNPGAAALLGQQGYDLLDRKGALDPTLEAERHLDLYRATWKARYASTG